MNQSSGQSFLRINERMIKRRQRLPIIRAMNDNSGDRGIKMSFIKVMNDNSGCSRHEDDIHKDDE